MRKGRHAKQSGIQKRERSLLVGSVKDSWRRWSLHWALKDRKGDMKAYSNHQAGKHWVSQKYGACIKKLKGAIGSRKQTRNILTHTVLEMKPVIFLQSNKDGNT